MAKRFQLNGKTAIITGAGSGIGRAVAQNWAAKGCDLALIDINAERLEETRQSLQQYDIRISTHLVDMGNPDAVRTFPAEFLKHHQQVDILLNNAGVALGGEFEDATEEEFNWLININMFGVINMTRAILPLLRQRPLAQVMNVSSIFGIIAPERQTAYCAAKFAVKGFSESLREELRDSAISVSVIHPGGIQTNIANDSRICDRTRQRMGDDLIEAERKAYNQLFYTTPAKAAEVITKGLIKRQKQIFIGSDAKFAAIMQRLLPVKYAALMRMVIKKPSLN